MSLVSVASTRHCRSKLTPSQGYGRPIRGKLSPTSLRGEIAHGRDRGGRDDGRRPGVRSQRAEGVRPRQARPQDAVQDRPALVGDRLLRAGSVDSHAPPSARGGGDLRPRGRRDHEHRRRGGRRPRRRDREVSRERAARRAEPGHGAVRDHVPQDQSQAAQGGYGRGRGVAREGRMGNVERCDKTLPTNEMIYHVRRDAALRARFLTDLEGLAREFGLSRAEYEAVRDKDPRRMMDLGVHQYYVPQILRLFFGSAHNSNASAALECYQRAYPEETAKALALQARLERESHG